MVILESSWSHPPVSTAEEGPGAAARLRAARPQGAAPGALGSAAAAPAAQVAPQRGLGLVAAPQPPGAAAAVRGAWDAMGLEFWELRFMLHMFIDSFFNK